MDRKIDLDIAQGCRMSHIKDIAGKLGIGGDYLECYGKYKAKSHHTVMTVFIGPSDWS